MPRTTNKEVHDTFDALCQVIGKPNLKNFTQYDQALKAGAWSLDHASEYGGWLIEEMLPTGGVTRSVFCETRMPAGEFVCAMRCACKAIWANQRVREEATNDR